jgi:hypothetical protein
MLGLPIGARLPGKWGGGVTSPGSLRATTTSGVKVAQHSEGLKMGLTLTMAPGGGA